MARLSLIGMFWAIRLCAADWFLVQAEAPVYPLLANQARIEGVVRLRLLLDGDGSVSRIDVISGHPILARVAQENIRAWKFSAPCLGQDNASRSIEFLYDFRLSGEVDISPKTSFRYEHPYKAVVVSQALHWMPSQGKKDR